MARRLGRQTVSFDRKIHISASAAVGGEYEGKGPLGRHFDVISNDAYFGEKTWEKAESSMEKLCFETLLKKAALTPDGIDFMLAGDLLNQCSGSAYALRASGIPHLGLYGACSTMAESLAIGAMLIDGGSASSVCAVTGSHFCSAERQFRFPLEYGGTRPPSTQWTVTAAGGIIMSAGSGKAAADEVDITHATVGIIHDTGLTDANNMGAAMAPAAFNTVKAHLTETGRQADYYDAIFTGDLGALGHDIFEQLFEDDGTHLGPHYMDCGMLIYDPAVQDVHSGGSGCGCCASVLAAHIIPAMRKGIWRRVLFAATGALHSPTTLLQGESIPAICHAVSLEVA